MRGRVAGFGAGCLLAALLPAAPGAAHAASGAYTGLAPTRILDTRLTGKPLGPGGVLNVTLPSTGSAIVNVTVTDATAPSFLTIWPAGQPRPTASSLNFAAGQTVANLVLVPTGTASQVSIYNLAGSVDVIFDLDGWADGGYFNAVAPARLLDTRASGGTPGPGSVYRLQVTGQKGLPSTLSGVVLNVTAVSPTQAGFITVYPDGVARPTASNLNFLAGQVVANRVIVPAPGGAVDLYNLAGNTDLVVDVTGWFGPSGGVFSGLPAPTRILDTRNGTGVQQQPLGPQGSITVQVAGAGGVPATGVAAVVGNLTVTDTTASSYFTAWPDSTSRPTASDLNFTAGQTVANMVVVPLGSSGKIDLYNNGGCTDAVLDVVGYFSGQPLAGTAPTPTVVACPPPPIPKPAGPEWLNHMNDYRSVGGVAYVTENTTFSSADCLHARYISETGQGGHTEDPSSAWYTAAGAQAGSVSNVAWTTDPNASDDYFIDQWMSGPFHAIGILRPGLQATGFCSYHDANRFQWASAAALNVLSGLGTVSVTQPYYFPGDGATIGIKSYGGHEIPDPLSSCPGYSAPAGLPVFVQLPAAVGSVTGHAFYDGASALPSCEESGSDYSNPDANSQVLGRELLANVIVVIPQSPLTSGHTYTVVIDADGQRYTWSFSAG